MGHMSSCEELTDPPGPSNDDGAYRIIEAGYGYHILSIANIKFKDAFFSCVWY